ncbi:DEHA2G22528p [Debaryomyces hansenii CBS767]|uniref:holo-[acyl-carrier-protein] synthase n=1 Tax=Debaryomyces hansenii (strain ATCC 36239 / CBS 767 / BCRC 21394 / JCM 1990 / NBRC 0083 / IGC 2968) TaxID=284592 RepID=B5RUX9_DEBHA|nr:DEHA2G22528p [Debaryomyces hansenii CBS767]CAR66023.1 DEHA2G22528p [Debaryomyces hansenii CBS767]|eukprot:XP_002770702.1 DEHA2G22528p [Debaryomyces hansenii CBS767]
MATNYKILSEFENFVVASRDIKEHRVLLFTTNTSTTALVDYLNDDFNFEMSLRLLNLKDQLAVRCQKNASSRYKQLINRLFAKLILNYVLYIYDPKDEFQPWKDLEFSYNQFGKPYLTQQDLYHFQFNMSSSNDIIGIVVELNALGPIGIDLSHSRQAISPTNFLEEFKPIFDPAEIEQLLEIKDISYRYIIFNQLWTLKEAFTKFLGSGLNIDLSKFCFFLNKSMVDDSIIATYDNELLISKFEVDWKRDIDLSVCKLSDEKNPFLLQLSSHHFNCYSGVLVESTSNDLPVIVSIINQTYDGEKHTVSNNFNVDFFRVLSDI